MIDPLCIQVYTRFLYPVTVKGEDEFHAGALDTELVGAKLLVDESAHAEPETVFNNKDVFEMLAKGTVLTVNPLV